MSKIEDGGPAFPQSDLSGYGMGPAPLNNGGMSLRDYFAGQALTGLGNWIPGDDSLAPSFTEVRERRAFWAYKQADAMLAARTKGGQP